MKSTSPLPPRWALRLLQWYCNPELLEEIQGDLYEAFADRTAQRGLHYARILYIRDVLAFIRPFARESRNTPAFPASRLELMRKYSYLSVRYLLRHRGFFALNVLGLAIGIASCLAIIHYVRFELGYDRFHQHADRIYRVSATLHSPESDDPLAPTFYGVGPTLQEEFPEVVAATRFVPTMAVVEDQQGVLFNEDYFFQADANVFQLFTYPLLAGDPTNALVVPHSVVLTQTTARKYFGHTDVSSLIGTSLTINRQVHQITGIMQDVPQNSDLRFDALLSWQYDPDEWLELNSYTYLLLQDSESVRTLPKKLSMFDQYQVTSRLAEVWGADDITVSHQLYPLTELHYTTHLLDDTEEKGDQTYVYIFLLAALGILFVAGINYVNLFVAQAGRRTVEVGVCQAMGAGRGQLRRQYLSECLITTLFAIIVAVGLVWLIGPHVGELLGEPITGQTLTHPHTLYILLGILLLISLLAGSYPAWVLSSLPPAKALKGGTLLQHRRGRLRKALIVLQFTVAISMVAGTLIVRDQVIYMQRKDLGFQQEQILSITIPDDTAVRQKTPLLKHALQQDTRVVKVATGSRPDALWSLSTFSVTAHGKTHPMSATGIPVDEDYLDVLDITLAAGRNFTPTGAHQVMVNEAFVRHVGWDDPVGEQIAFSDTEIKEIVGVVQDFHYAPLHQRIEPFILFYDTSTPINLLLKVAPKDLEAVQALWPNFFPDFPLVYEFLDEAFDRKYRTERRMLTLFNYFSALSIFVACIGLLGLTATVAQQKTKEIGIRKVLGAGKAAILYLLSREFGGLLLLAGLVATPVAYVAMYFWLQNFAYRTGITLQVFLLAGGGVGILALLTLSYHTLRAAATNPVDTLRHE